MRYKNTDETDDFNIFTSWSIINSLYWIAEGQKLQVLKVSKITSPGNLKNY